MPLAQQIPTFTGGRLRLTPAAPAPAPRSSGATPGFSVEPLPHGMAQLIDPRGVPCGVFATASLAPSTLSFLAR